MSVLAWHEEAIAKHHIDAKSVRGAAWYVGYGAVPLDDEPLSLLLPLRTIHAALTAAGQL